MQPTVKLALFDVNETLSDMVPLQARFEEVGAPGALLPAWFAGVLRDGFALTAAGAYADFRDIAAAGLRGVLGGVDGWDGDLDAAVEHVLKGFADLEVHPDVPEGVRMLHEAGIRLATLTNGAAAMTDGLLRRAGVRDLFETLLDVGAPRAWKPAAASYAYALDRLGAEPAETVLIAVHPWDVDGALRAGLKAAWLQRGAPEYPAVMTEPTWTAPNLRALAETLTAS